jgi:hypothetical protein
LELAIQPPAELSLSILFAPTGPIQEVSLSSGWGGEFLKLASTFDAALDEVYRQGIAEQDLPGCGLHSKTVPIIIFNSNVKGA